MSAQAGEARANELVESLRAERNKQTEWAHSMQAMATEAKVSEAETRARLTGTIESLQASLYAVAASAHERRGLGRLRH